MTAIPRASAPELNGGMAARVLIAEGDLAELRGILIAQDAKLERLLRAERTRRAPQLAAVGASGLIFERATEALRDPSSTAHLQTMVICLCVLIAMVYTHRRGGK